VIVPFLSKDLGAVELLGLIHLLVDGSLHDLLCLFKSGLDALRWIPHVVDHHVHVQLLLLEQSLELRHLVGVN